MSKTILIRHHVTEKSMNMAANGWYTFLVKPESTKGQIQNAVEEEFKVHVTDIKTIRLKSEYKRRGRKRLLSKTPAFKKAVVKLKANEKIDLFEVEKTK